MVHHTDTIVGTSGGVILSVSYLPSSTSISTTIILATIGACVGFVTTMLLKALWAYIKRNKNASS